MLNIITFILWKCVLENCISPFFTVFINYWFQTLWHTLVFFVLVYAFYLMFQIHRLLSKHFGSFLESKTFNVQDNKTADVGGSYIQIRMRVRRPKPLRQNGNEGNSRYVQWSVSLSVCLSAIQSVHQLICLHPFCLSICLSVSQQFVSRSVSQYVCLSVSLCVSQPLRHTET